MEIVQILTSWPPWIGLIGVVFLFLFRPQIGDLLRRIIGIGKGGITATPHEQISPTTADPRAGADELLSYLDNQHLRSQEEIITKALALKGLHEDTPEKVRVLTRYTATFAIMADFERIYGAIYGSQIHILTYLNPRDEVPRAEITPFYERATEVQPLFENYPFEQYINFLILQGLTEQKGDSYSITLKGQTFLLYLVNARKPAREF